MSDFKNKYKFSERRLGAINWIGFFALYKKEVLRFLVVWIQTLFSPLISGLLFLLVLSLAIGNDRGDVLGVPFITFLAPGIICMTAVIQQSFSHSSSSIMIGKIQGNIVDMLYAPLSPAEVTLSIILAAATRSFMISFISIIVFSFFVDISINNIIIIITYMFLGSFILGAVGFIAGLWSEKFDHMASITNFIIIPLSFLSGTFYSIDRLPYTLQKISEINPFFYMIDGFRYGFIGESDGSIRFGLIYLALLSIICWFLAYFLYKKGYKIKF